MLKMIGILLIILLFSSKICLSQEITKIEKNNLKRKNHFSEMQRIYILDKMGNSYGGFYFGESENYLYVVSEDKDSIAKKEISSIRLSKKSSSEEASIYGCLAGIYLGNLLYFKSKEQPKTYLAYRQKDVEWYYLANVLFGLTGAGVTALLEPVFTKNYEEFKFSGDDTNRDKEWLRFKKYLAEPTYKKFHVSFQTSKVYIHSTETFNKYLENTGFISSNYQSSHFYNSLNNDVNVNLLRNICVSYSIDSTFEFGLSLTSLSEPKLVFEKNDYIQNIHKYYQVVTYLNSNGFFIAANYKPAFEFIPDWLSVNIGGGLGITSVDFGLSTKIDSAYVNIHNKLIEISKNYISIEINSALYFNIYSGLNLGLIYDYCYIPSEKIEDIPEFGISSQDIDFGNRSLGLILRFNF